MVRLNSNNGLFALSLIISVVAFSLPFAAAAQNVAAREVPESAEHGRIAFTGDREGQSAPDEIYVMNADGTGEFRLTPTTHSTNCFFPRWSPNGHQVAFHCADNTMSDIFVINDDGTGLTQLTHFGTTGAAFASWSHDGKRIAFGAGDSFLYIVDMDSGTSTRLIVGSRPDWSPDGRQIAFQRRDGAIYVVELEDLEHPVRLTDLSSDPSVVNRDPRWSPNGRKITFVRGSPNRDGNRQILVMNANGEDQVELTHFPGNDAFPSWSPDGRWIVFNRQLCDPSVLGQHNPNGSDLFFIASDGSQEIQVTHGGCQGAGGTFGSDSTFSAFASWAPGHRR